jgi:hypothetical protein
MEEMVRLKKGSDEITDLQDKLVPLVQQLFQNKKICFTSDYAVGSESGNNWKPVEDIPGSWLHESFNERPDFVIETSWRVARDYQRVVALAQETGIVADARELEAGKAWVFGSLLKWSGSLVESGDLHHREVVGLTEEFEKVIERKREDFFGFFHGNVIGDHLLLDAFRTPYLFGMRIVLRPGNGYYDFLRALDWLILKTPTHEKTFDDVVGWMRTYLLGEDWEEVKLVFALRCIGILGWDMLHRGDRGAGDFSSKKEVLLRFIRRQY